MPRTAIVITERLFLDFVRKECDRRKYLAPRNSYTIEIIQPNDMFECMNIKYQRLSKSKFQTKLLMLEPTMIKDIFKSANPNANIPKKFNLSIVGTELGERDFILTFTKPEQNTLMSLFTW